MKQVLLENLRDGSMKVADVPVPRVGASQLLIRTRCSLISAGTERMLVDFGKATILDKARQQPDKVQMVLDKVRTDGLAPTLESVRSKLDRPLPMGYSNAGTVIAVGANCQGYSLGDRVLSNGNHAEVVTVPANLCAKIPDSLSYEESAFGVIGAIALQGIRLVQPTLGEAVVVTGLGLVGLIAVQLLRASGCRVLGVDMDPLRLDMARSFGADVVDVGAGEDLLNRAERFSRGRGVDAVLLTATTKSSEPVRQAAQMCRKRGRVVLVGVTGLELSRAEFYEKELMFQVSCSYGPGRYDRSYEEGGHDYPIGFVRWTEQRNFEAILDMLADGRVDVKPLITHRYKLEEAPKAYQLISSGEQSLGVVLEYPAEPGLLSEAGSESVIRLPKPVRANEENPRPCLAFVGAGNYAVSVLIPAFRRSRARLLTVASNGGVNGVYAARKFGLEETTTDTEQLFSDPRIDGVVVATRHNSHAEFVIRALTAGKHVFVEKPLCLTVEELANVEAAYAAAQRSDLAASPLLMIGFNRRFAPHVQRAKVLLDAVSGPKSFVMTINAGAIPSDHWVQDAEIGGGRIVGEACHFIDLLRFLAGSAIVSYSKMQMGSATSDTASLHLKFADGSIGTAHYMANGPKRVPKERLEVFAAGRFLQLDNFRVLRGYGWTKFNGMRLWRQDKGQRDCALAFVEAIRTGGLSPTPFEEVVEISRASIELAR